jgi:hypothetical protein
MVRALPARSASANTAVRSPGSGYASRTICSRWKYTKVDRVVAMAMNAQIPSRYRERKRRTT